MVPRAMAWVAGALSLTCKTCATCRPEAEMPRAGGLSPQGSQCSEPRGEREAANPLYSFFKLTVSGPVGPIKYSERPPEVQANVPIAGNVFSS